MSDKIDKIVEKLFDVNEAEWYGPRGSNFDKIAARSAHKPEDDEPKEKPESYRDWLARQPKPKNIGIHKNKK